MHVVIGEFVVPVGKYTTLVSVQQNARACLQTAPCEYRPQQRANGDAMSAPRRDERVETGTPRELTNRHGGHCQRQTLLRSRFLGRAATSRDDA